MIYVAIIIVLLSFTVFFGAPFVPSKRADLEIAFSKLYKISDKDFIVDLGAGNGIVLKVAGKFGAGGIGYELNPLYAFWAKLKLRKSRGMKIRVQNYLLAKFPPETTVVYAFSESRDIEKIAKKIQAEAERLGHEIYFISYAFQIPDKKPLKKVNTHFLYKFSAK